MQYQYTDSIAVCADTPLVVESAISLGDFVNQVLSTSPSSRQYVSTGSPFEPKVGISRAVRSGRIIAVTGTAPLGPDGKTMAKGNTGVERDAPA